MTRAVRIDTEPMTGTTGVGRSVFYLVTPEPKRSPWARLTRAVAAFLGIVCVTLVCGLVRVG